MEAMLLCSSQRGLLAQAQCHTNCSDIASGSELTHVRLTRVMGRKNPCLPGKDPGSVTSVHRNPQLHALLLLWMCFLIFPVPLASATLLHALPSISESVLSLLSPFWFQR